MSGWRRLWIVLSLLIGIPAALIGFDANSHAFFFVPLSADEQALPTARRDEVFWNRARTKPEGKLCDQSTMKAGDSSYDGGWYVACQFPFHYSLGRAIFWGIIPAAIMWAIGSTFRWIYRGFRPPA